MHAAEIRNRFICPRSDFKTAYELMTSTKPRVDHLRVFGSLAWALYRKNRDASWMLRVRRALLSAVSRIVFTKYGSLSANAPFCLGT